MLNYTRRRYSNDGAETTIGKSEAVVVVAGGRIYGKIM